MTDNDDLLTYYLDWTSKALMELDKLLVHLKSEKGAEGLNTKMYAIAHNLKGMGSSFGFDLMTASGASLCEYLRKLEERNASASVVGAHLKAMKVILDKRITGDGGDDGKALVARLNKLAKEDIS